jgi:uncharacterized membrane protein YoaK (UPF0700 family)
VLFDYARRLTGSNRSAAADWQLGLLLAFISGAVNAGGFLAIGQYTSHMTGIVSSMADNLVLGAQAVALGGAAALLSFLAGAMTTAILVNWARRRCLSSLFAGPLLLEALLLLVFGVVGAQLQHITGLIVPATVMLLCFIMGLQNAVISKVSHATIRTTHVTGIVTDLGIELGKAVYWNGTQASQGPRVSADKQRLRVLAGLLGSFFAGAVAGALAFSHIGYVATVPLAAVLMMVAGVPAMDDLRKHLHRSH